MVSKRISHDDAKRSNGFRKMCYVVLLMVALWFAIRIAIEIQSRLLVHVGFVSISVLLFRLFRRNNNGTTSRRIAIEQISVVLALCLIVEVFCVIPLLSLKEIKRRAELRKWDGWNSTGEQKRTGASKG